MSEPTPAELRAQLAAMQAQMAALQAQLAAQQTDRDGLAQAGGVAAGERGIATGGDLDNNTIVTGDNNSVTQIRAVYLQAPGQAEVAEQTFDEALGRYLLWVSKRYGQLSLRGIERREQQPLTLTLDDVYVSLAATVSADRKAQRRQATAEGTLGEGERTLIDMEQLLTLGPRLMIVGGPGSGKTTYLHIIAATLAAALYSGETAAVAALLGLQTPLPLPIFITLSEYNQYRRQLREAADPRQGTLSAFITHALIRQEALIGLPGDFFTRLLTQGHSCLLLLDGLDEVADERERWLVRQAVENVAHNRGIRQIVVTCRTRAYQDEAVLPEEFRVAEVQPMTDSQVNRLAERWCAAAYSPLTAAQETPRLQGAIAHLESLRTLRSEPRLVETPLLVTIVAIVHYNQRRLPDERAELYEKCVDVLLTEKHHGVSESTFALADWGGSLTEKRNLLAYLAFQLMSAGEEAGRAVTEAQLARWLRPQLARKHGEAQADDALAIFVGAMRERGSLLDERGGVYRFIHLTFQEFLCAFYLAESVREIDKIADFFSTDQRLIDPWWRETVLLTVGYLGLRSQESALTLVRRLALTGENDETTVAAAEVAATALIELDSQDAETVAQLRPGLLRLFDPTAVVSGRLRGAAGAALGRLGDPRPGVGTKDGLPDVDWVTIEPGPFVMGSDQAADGEAFDDEMPQFTCDLIQRPYQISRYPITVAQYQCFVAAGGYGEGAYWREGMTAGLWQAGRLRVQTRSRERGESFEEWAVGPAEYGGAFAVDNHPQVGVSWYEALAFCHWLAIQTGKTIHLSTEAEWERAARHNDGRLYPWGNTGKPDDQCNMFDAQVGCTSAVGAFPRGNAKCGAADLLGNVWEWTCSLWGKDGEKPNYGYPYDPTDGWEDLAAPVDVRRVVRGGSFGDYQHSVRCAVRGRFNPVNRVNYVGFRVVRHETAREN